MKFLIIILASLGIEIHQPTDHFTSGERTFINNVIDMSDNEPQAVYRLSNGKIQMDFKDKRITLGDDGFIHDYYIYEQGKWINLGPEY